MKRGRLFLSIAAALLLALNLWQWLPRGGNEHALPATSGSFLPQDFYLKTTSSVVMTQSSTSRNVFEPRLPPPPKVIVKAPVLPPPPPPKTPEQLAEEASRAELTQIKLVGIVFRGNKGQAFLVKGDQVFLSRVGDKVGDHFTLDSISTESVLLKDAATNVSGQIEVSGK